MRDSSLFSWFCCDLSESSFITYNQILYFTRKLIINARNCKTQHMHSRTNNMNKTDYTIHIHTENDTLLGRIERESHDAAIEDVNRVRRFIIGALVVFATTIATVAIVVTCL